MYRTIFKSIFNYTSYGLVAEGGLRKPYGASLSLGEI
jgi:hypothetical protein